MTQKYVVTDDQGRAAAFFDDAIHAGQIPENAEPISDALWRAWVKDTAGQVLDNGMLRQVAHEDLMPVDKLAVLRKRQVNNRRDKAYEDGFTWQGDVYDIDPVAQMNMTAAYALLKGGVSSPHGGAWRTRDNRMVTMDDTALEVFLQEAAKYVLAIKQASWTHKDALSGIAGRADLRAYDINAAWPGAS